MSYPQPKVDSDTARVGFQPQAALSTVKYRVEKLLSDRGLTQHWLQDRIGVTKTGYREMWQRESVRVVVMQRMAEALGVNLCDLLLADAPELATVAAEAPARYGTGRYLEDRVANLEQELQNLKAKLKLQ